MSPADDDALAAALARAEADLQEATAGQALCRIDGSGGPTPFFVKRAEGVRAALADVRRARKGDPGRDIRAAAVDTLRRWEADLAGWRKRGAPPWIAYAEGGCAAIEALLDDVTRPDPA